MATINLSSYLTISPVVSGAVTQQQLAIFNNGRGTSAQDGGLCCCWIVPANTSYVTFEMWGAGGDGGGACCCMGGSVSPSPGNYIKKTITTNPCAYYTICAAGSGCCSQQCLGTNGFPSFALNPLGSVVACAAGGCGGQTKCHAGMGCTSCTGAVFQGCNVLGLCSGSADINVLGIQNPSHQTDFCAQFTFQRQGGTPKFQPNSRHSTDVCSVGTALIGCSRYYCTTLWPGGPGAEATACGGGCCWGAWGASGLVLITYG